MSAAGAKVFDLVLANALSATLLAAIVALLRPRIRNPAVLHAAFGLVLLKLLLVPVVEWRVLPRWTDGTEGNAPVVVPAEDRHAAAAPASSPRIPFAPLGAAVALSGTLALLAASLLRAHRFARLLPHAPDSDELQGRADILARELGLRGKIRVQLVPANISPAVWSFGRGARILFPAALVARLSSDERDALLAHELAHVRRGDPWLRPLELLAMALWWWHPVMWWARRNFRQAEERACDAFVLECRPATARVYAGALLAVAEFLAGSRVPSPALVTGAASPPLMERILMILEGKPARPWGRSLRIAAAVLVVPVLLVGPIAGDAGQSLAAVADRAPAPPPVPGSPAAPAPAPLAAPAPPGAPAPPAPFAPLPPFPPLAFSLGQPGFEESQAAFRARMDEFARRQEEFAERARDFGRSAFEHQQRAFRLDAESAELQRHIAELEAQRAQLEVLQERLDALQEELRRRTDELESEE